MRGPNLLPLLGLGLGALCLLGALELEGQTVRAFFSLPALLVVLGGSLGASLISLRWKDRQDILAIIRGLFANERRERLQLAGHLVDWAREGRRQGVLALQPSLVKVDMPIVARALQALADGEPADRIELLFELEKVRRQRYFRRGEQFLESLGGYSPTFGIIGTVMVLVSVLGDMQRPEALAQGVASAFIATFYGIVFANLVFLPLARRVERECAEEVETLEMLATGFKAIAIGEHPTVLKDRLQLYLDWEEEEEAA